MINNINLQGKKLGKRIGLLSASFLLLASGNVYGQSAVDAMRIADPDMKGTARYMSMGGAFGALGGDLTTLTMNPAGIGVYRNNEIGVTVDLDAISTSSTSQAGVFNASKTPFLLNNAGGVLTLKLKSSTVPNLNFGFTYNRQASFNNRYGGQLGRLNTSMTNWIAGVANSESVPVDYVTYGSNFNPYDPYGDDYAAPWITILGYQAGLINPIGNLDDPDWEGQFVGASKYDPATSGTAYYSVEEKGGIDSFNIAFGGNFANFIYWGMDFDISNINYTRNTFYGENLDNASVESNVGLERTTSDWSLQNWYNISGTGYTYKLGVILRPIQELRIGVAFHTPTYYTLTQEYSAKAEAYYNGESNPVVKYSNQDKDGYWNPGYNDMRFVSPWKVMVSAAGVIANRLIVSADYQWDLTSKMHFKDPAYYSYYDYPYYGDYFGGSNNSYDYDVNPEIDKYYTDIHTLRVGAELRLAKPLSLRVGYSNVSSGVTDAASSGKEIIYTAGTMPDYSFKNSTNYYTCGLGWHKKGFYADLAYVYKTYTSTYHAFSGDPDAGIQVSPTAKVKFNANQVVMSLGYKF